MVYHGILMETIGISVTVYLVSHVSQTNALWVDANCPE